LSLSKKGARAHLGTMRWPYPSSGEYRGTSLMRNSPPLRATNAIKALGILLLQNPRGALFLMSEVPQSAHTSCRGACVRAQDLFGVNVAPLAT
jgi:hypothetical protein